MGDTCFSPQALALLGVIASALVAGYVKLYRDGTQSRDNQIADLSTRLTAATGRLQTGAAVMDVAEAAIRSRAAGRRH